MFHWMHFVEEQKHFQFAKLSSGVENPRMLQTTEKDGVLENGEKDVLEFEKFIPLAINTNEKKLMIQCDDAKIPWMKPIDSFEELKLQTELMKGIRILGFKSPSGVQKTVLPIALTNPPKNMIVQSELGAGKTTAAALVMLSRVDPKIDEPQILCLVPTRELAMEIGLVTSHLSVLYNAITIGYAVSGADTPKRNIADKIIIGTPDKVLDWSLKYSAFGISEITTLILDEADVMISTRGFHNKCYGIYKRLSSQCQTIIFFNTFNKEIIDLVNNIVPKAIIIRQKEKQKISKSVQQNCIKHSSVDEIPKIENIYKCIHIGKGIINSSNGQMIICLGLQKKRNEFVFGVLCEERSAIEKFNIMNRLKLTVENVLVTTESGLKGIDEKEGVLANFELPSNSINIADSENHLYRNGTSGNFNKPAIVIKFIDARLMMRTLQKKTHIYSNAIKRSAKETSNGKLKID